MASRKNKAEKPRGTERKPAGRQQTKSYPGSIYVPSGTNRIHIKYKLEKFSTGLPDTRENRALAVLMLMDLYRAHHGLPRTVVPVGPVDAPALVPVEVPAPAPIPEPEKSSRVPDVTPEQETVKARRYSDVQEEYALYLDARDLDPRTRVDYKAAVVKILADLDREISVEDIERQIENWKRRTTHLKPGATNVLLRSFRAFCRFLRTKKYTPALVELPQFFRKGAKKPVYIYEEFEYGAVITHFETCNPPGKKSNIAVYREVAIFLRFLIATGFRVKEALSLERTQIKRDHIELVNKRTRDSERFPLTAEVRTIIAALPAKRQKLFRWAYASQSSLLRIIKRGFDAVGHESRSGFHTFRKTFAHELYLQGVDLLDRKEALRHLRIETTVACYSYTETLRLGDVLNKAAMKKKRASRAKTAKRAEMKETVRSRKEPRVTVAKKPKTTTK